VHPSGISFGVHVDVGIGRSADCKLVKGDASLGDATLVLEAAVSPGLTVFKGARSIIIDPYRLVDQLSTVIV